MHCGCPLPGDTIGQRTLRLTKHVLSTSEKSAAAASPFAVPVHPDAAAGTHPSDHNAVSVLPHDVSEKNRRARREKLEKRKVRDGMGEGELAHGSAFLVASPLWHVEVNPAAGTACVSDAERWSGGVLTAARLLLGARSALARAGLEPARWVVRTVFPTVVVSQRLICIAIVPVGGGGYRGEGLFSGQSGSSQAAAIMATNVAFT